jgi:hypothetical protein
MTEEQRAMTVDPIDYSLVTPDQAADAFRRVAQAASTAASHLVTLRRAAHAEDADDEAE